MDCRNAGCLSLLLSLLMALLPAAVAVTRVGIIGGGISGTATAYYLSQLMGRQVEIDVFEMRDRVGGRLALAQVTGHSYESGGCVIHTRNRLAMSLINELGLARCGATSGETLGITDGSRLLFGSSRYSWLTWCKLLWRYGYDVVRLHSLVNTLLDQFDLIYDKLDAGRSYDSLVNLLYAMDESMVKLVALQLHQYLRSNGLGRPIIDELVAAATTVNYGQKTTIHALVGMVAVAGTVGELTCVANGNRQLAERALAESGASLIRERALSVTLTSDGKYVVDSTTTTTTSAADGSGSGSGGVSQQQQQQRTYDVIVLASPMTSDHKWAVKLHGITTTTAAAGAAAGTIEFPGRYLPLSVTFVDAQRREGLWSSVDDLLCNEQCSRLNSIGRVYSVKQANAGDTPPSSVHKLFSSTPLSDEWLQQHVFEPWPPAEGGKSSPVQRVSWLAYPRYPVRPLALNSTASAQSARQWAETARFRLHTTAGGGGGVFYTSAVEVAASAIEMALLAARNVANAVCADSGATCRRLTTLNSHAHEEL